MQSPARLSKDLWTVINVVKRQQAGQGLGIKTTKLGLGEDYNLG